MRKVFTAIITFMLAVIIFAPAMGYTIRTEGRINYSINEGAFAETEIVESAENVTDTLVEPIYPFTVVEKVPVMNGLESVAESALLTLTANSLAEDGCEIFKVYNCSSNNSSSYILYENWNSATAYSDHLKSPEYATFEASKNGFISGDIEVLKAQMITPPQGSSLENSTISVISIMQAQPGKIDQAKNELLAIVDFARSHGEWNAAYDLHQGIDDPSLFICHENWWNQTAVNSYLETSEFNDFISKKDALFVGGNIEVNFCSLVKSTENVIDTLVEPIYPFTVVEKVPVMNGLESVAESALLTLTANSLAEDGCEIFKVYNCSSNNSSPYILYENWNSATAYSDHLKSPEYATFEASKNGFISGDIEVLKAQMITPPQGSSLENSTISVISIMQAQPGKIDQAKNELLAIVDFARSHGEWNAAYDLHQGIDDPSLFICHENWWNQTAVNSYLETSEFNDFISKKDALFVGGNIEVNFCSLC